LTEQQIQSEPFVLNLRRDLFIRGDVKVVPDDGVRKSVLLVCHGFKAFKDWGFFPYAASWFAERGYLVVSFNFSCNGVHERDFDELDKFSLNTYSREQSDLAELLRQIKEGMLPLSHYGDSKRIYVLGHSRGGGNGILFAAEHEEISALATWNGIASANLFDEAFEAESKRNGIAYTLNARTKQYMPIHYGFFQDLALNRERYDIPARLAELDIPVLLIQGDQDGERLLTGFQKLRQAAPKQQFVMIRGAGHTFGAIHPFAGTTDYLDAALDQTHAFFQSVDQK
jgi:pimeloyl-ACP methyl ester carboxylesterase